MTRRKITQCTTVVGVTLLAAFIVGCGDDSNTTGNGNTTPPVMDTLQVEKVAVGKLLYFDTNLSSPSGQACASCHDPETGFAEPHAELPVSQGVLPWLVGNRNAPTAAYAAFSPAFHYDEAEKHYVGGQFWDGRASTLADQAKGPFLNPVEMHNPDKATVVASVKASAYANLFERLYGEGIFDDVEKAYDNLADAIAAFESSKDVVRFTSKFDAVAAGKATFTEAEARGKTLFEDTNKSKCSACHVTTPHDADTPPLFTDFTYDNLGVPKNPTLPFYDMPAEFNPAGVNFIDMGLGPIVAKASENGKFKVPTLRNIAKTGPYMHNGVFKTLREVVEFYNSRDVDPAKWGPPEVAENVNIDELGDLKLTATEIDDIVAFMLTLTDGYVPPGK